MEGKGIVGRNFKIFMAMAIFLLVIIIIAGSVFLMNDDVEKITEIGENDKNAATITSSDGKWQYSVNDDGTSITLKQYNGSIGESSVIIPEMIDGYTVTVLNLYLDGSYVDNLTLPNTVSEIIGISGNVPGPGNIIIDNNNPYFINENGVVFNTEKTELIKYLYYYKKEDTTYTVPSTVRKIANYAFDSCNNLLDIELQEGIISIGAEAFNGCSFTNIKLPSTLKTIGEIAFSGCSNLISIEIPEGVTEIGHQAFWRCEKLESIKLPSTLKIIRPQMFYKCNSLKTIDIPFGIERIESKAFFYMENLETLNISASVKYIESGIFLGSNKLISVNVDENNENYTSENGILFNKDKTELLVYPPNKVEASYTIPTSVTYIADEAFYKCNNLKILEIPKSVTIIHDDAFKDKGNLTIHCYRNSKAHEFAQQNSINYVLIDGITGIEITTLPEKLNYVQNSEDLSLVGGVLTLTYSDGNTDTINMTTETGDITEGITITGFDNTEIGEKTITVNYEGQTAEFNVNIIEKQLTKIEITKNPTKTSYKQNKENLNLTGGEITVTYNDNTTEKVAMTDTNVTASQLDNTTLGEKEITITYQGQTAKLKVEVIQDFDYEETEDGTGIIIKGTEEGPYIVIPDNIDGKPVVGIGEGAFKDRDDIISVQIPDTVTNIAPDAFEGDDEVTIITNSGTKAEEYAEENNMNYELLNKTIQSISVSKNPNKTTYIIGDQELQTKGGKIQLTYTDGTTSTTNMRMQGMILTGFNTEDAGEKEITVAYKEKTAKFNITVEAKVSTKIEITKNPTKTSYKQNKENLNLAGGEITVTYNNNTTEKIAMTDTNVATSGFNNKTLGKQEITITYQGKTAKLNVEVIQDFDYEETEDGTGIIIKGTEEGPYIVIPDNIDGKPVVGIGEGAFKDRDDIISVQIPDTVTDIAPDAFEGDDEVTIITNSGTKAEEFAKDNDMNYELLNKTIQRISVNKNPNKTTYIIGDEELQTKGGKILLTYTDGTTSTTNMRMQGMELTGFNTEDAGEKEITVTYREKTTKFNITVIAKTVTKIQITKNPTKTSYKQNKENLDLTGGEITVTYNDNTTEKISMTDNNVTSSQLDNTTLGDKEITLTYKGQTAKLKVNVIQEFDYEETEDGTGIIINGTEEGPYIVIPDNIDGKPVVGIGEGAFKDRDDIISVQIPDTVTDIAKDAFEGNDEVTIITNSGTKAEEYAKENDMNYELLDKTIGSISVNKNPDKTIYTKEDTKIDVTGGKILLTYTDGTTSKISMKMQGMKITGFDNTVIGKQNIKVEYKTKETTFEIEIKGKTILLGDINKDGKIDSTDLLLMKRHIIAQSKTEWILKGENFEAGDMNIDGKINATDLLLLKREIVKGNSK